MGDQTVGGARERGCLLVCEAAWVVAVTERLDLARQVIERHQFGAQAPPAGTRPASGPDGCAITG